MDLLHVVGYLIIFLPLISCFLCLLTNLSKSGFFIFTSTNFLVLILSIFLMALLPNYKSHIVSFVTNSITSIAINYSFSYLGLFFIIMVSFIKFITSIFYRNALDSIFNKDSRQLFYALNALNLFSIIGLFSTNNLMNIYLFIEIYSFTFCVMICACRDQSLNNIIFKYFYQGSVGSILVVVSFFLLFVNYNSIDLDFIYNQISQIRDKTQIFTHGLLFLVFIIGIVLKFFPLWIYFDHIKSPNHLSYFISSRILLIKVNIGFYLIFKSIYFLFGVDLIFNQLRFGEFLIFLAFILIVFSNVKILTNNNFKIISSYFCIIYFGFSLISLSINSENGIIAAISYISHYSIIGLIMLMICSYMTFKFNSCNIKNLSFLKNGSCFTQYFFKITIPFICAFPLTFLFIGNWHLSYEVLRSSYLILILLPMATTFLVFANLAVKMISYFYFDSGIVKSSNDFNNLQDNIYYLISFTIAVCVVILLVLKSDITLDIFRNLSLYLQ